MNTAPPPHAFFHVDTAAVRFWVDVDGGWVGAILRESILFHCFGAERGDSAESAQAGAMRAFESHAEEIAGAVRRRVAGGSIEPVLLREADFPARVRASR